MLRVGVGPGVPERRRLIEGRNQRRQQSDEQIEDDNDDADLRGDAHFVAADTHNNPSLSRSTDLDQRGWRSRGLDRMARMSAIMLSRMKVAAKISPHAWTTGTSCFDTSSTINCPRPG